MSKEKSQLNIQLPPGLLAALRIKAAKKGVSVATIARPALARLAGWKEGQ